MNGRRIIEQKRWIVWGGKELLIDIVCVAHTSYKLIEKTIRYHLSLSRDFRMVICDNTPAQHRDRKFLKRMSELDRVKAYDFINESDYDGENHGAALDFLVSQCESEIIGTIDHDFFWLRPDTYDWVVELFEMGYKAVGAGGWYPEHSPHWQQSIDTNFPERHGLFAPVCWGQFISKDIATKQTFMTMRDEGPRGCETGWRLRKFLIDEKVKTLVLPGFQYERQPDKWACFFGTKKVPVGLHLLKGIHRDFDAEERFFNELIAMGKKQWEIAT